jgi:hypothetical protein
MYRRLTRLATLAVVNLCVVLVAIALPGWIGIALVLVASVPIYVAIGPFQADLALNDGLTELERTRWRIALYLVPWSMALYWHHHVRRR